MRKLFVLIATAAALSAQRGLADQPARATTKPARLAASSAAQATASDVIADKGGDGDCGCSEDGCGEDGSGGRRGCGGRRNANRWFNCNCNGSYKFPVPPLYTYHWPGLYSMQRMTDYHSPWRFPAIKPYEDETPVRDLSRRPEFRQASDFVEGVEAAPAAQEEPVSAKIARRYSAE
jgi:hypothetical protein